jgi:hypothetical protein
VRAFWTSPRFCRRYFSSGFVGAGAMDISKTLNAAENNEQENKIHCYLYVDDFLKTCFKLGDFSISKYWLWFVFNYPAAQSFEWAK